MRGSSHASLITVITVAVTLLLSSAGCERSARAPRPDAGFERTLTEGPVETVPRAIGGGPPTGAVSRDDARARIAAARCRVLAMCAELGQEQGEMASDGPDACSTRASAGLSISCEEIDAARLDACVGALNSCSDGDALPSECAAASLCR